MNTTSRSGGSDREQYVTLDLSAASRWACGMPLSYVLEMADRWLNQQQQDAPGKPRKPILDPASSPTGKP